MSHVAERFSWLPSCSCSPPGHPFPIKPLALSVHVSSWTIHFRVLDKSPVWGPGRGPPSCNNFATLHCTSNSSYCSSSFPFALCRENKYFPNSRGTISFLIFSVVKENVISKKKKENLKKSPPHTFSSLFFFVVSFLAVLGLHAAHRRSLVVVSGAALRCCVWASRCGGFSCFGTQAPGRARFGGCNSWALERRLSGCGT